MSLSRRARLSFGPKVDYSGFRASVFDVGVPSVKSILQSVKDANESDSALAGVGIAEQFVCQDSGSFEIMRAFRIVDVYAKHAATLGKLHDVLMSA